MNLVLDLTRFDLDILSHPADQTYKPKSTSLSFGSITARQTSLFTVGPSKGVLGTPWHPVETSFPWT